MTIEKYMQYIPYSNIFNNGNKYKGDRTTGIGKKKKERK